MKCKQTVDHLSKLAYLSDFNFEIEYRSGRSNGDELSRIPVDESGFEIEDDGTFTITTQQQLLTFIRKMYTMPNC